MTALFSQGVDMADWLTTWSVWHWLVLGFVLLIAETPCTRRIFIVVGLWLRLWQQA